MKNTKLLFDINILIMENNLPRTVSYIEFDNLEFQEVVLGLDWRLRRFSLCKKNLAAFSVMMDKR